MGCLFWLAEEGLRDIVVLDFIDYFVEPVCRIICKHEPTMDDPTCHVQDIHRSVMRTHRQDWIDMLERGVVSRELLKALLEGTDWEHITRLLEKFQV